MSETKDTALLIEGFEGVNALSVVCLKCGALIHREYKSTHRDWHRSVEDRG